MHGTKQRYRDNLRLILYVFNQFPEEQIATGGTLVNPDRINSENFGSSANSYRFQSVCAWYMQMSLLTKESRS